MAMKRSETDQSITGAQRGSLARALYFSPTTLYVQPPFWVNR
jgi:hypothetical protein